MLEFYVSKKEIFFFLALSETSKAVWRLHRPFTQIENFRFFAFFKKSLMLYVSDGTITLQGISDQTGFYFEDRQRIVFFFYRPFYVVECID